MIDNGNGVSYYETDSTGKIIGASDSPFTPQPGNTLQTHPGKIFRGEDGLLYKDTQKDVKEQSQDNFGYSPLLNFDTKTAPTKEVIITAAQDCWLAYRFTNQYNGYLQIFPNYPSTSTTVSTTYQFLDPADCCGFVFISKNTRYKVYGNCGVDLYYGGY